MTPCTPKPYKNTATPLRSRSRNSRNYHPYSSGSGRSTRTRRNQNESIVSDYSTPKTTRTLITPPTKSGAKFKNGKQVTQFVYRPLELNNESSSESTDYLLRHQCITPPITPERIKDGELKSKQNLQNLDGNKSEPKLHNQDQTKPMPNGPNLDKKKTVSEIDLDKKKTASEIQNAEETKSTPKLLNQDESKSMPRLRNFIPGNCNIDEVLRIYGSTCELPTKKAKIENQTQAR